MRDFGGYDEDKEQMNGVLWAILCGQGPNSLPSSEWDRLFADFDVIINTERI
jgi:hypothetical protein